MCFEQAYIFAIALILITGSYIIASTAEATEPDYDDPQVVISLLNGLATADKPYQELNSLTPEARQAVIDGLKATTVTRSAETVVEGNKEQGTSAYTSASCTTQKITFTYKNTYGIRLFRYISSTRWCWDGTEITNDPYFRAYGKVDFLVWEYVGNINETTSGGQGEWSHHDFAQGHFRLCVETDKVSGCIKHVYPAIDKSQYGDGTSTYSY